MRHDKHRRRIFLEKLSKGIDAAGMDLRKRVVCAISGGFDSTALLLGLHQLGASKGKLVAAHFNHRLRGTESDEDEAFVRDLCASRGIDLNVDTAVDTHLTIGEAEARNQRYNFLCKVAEAHNADFVALAHTIEDQAETLLLRLTRGAGVRGASAMRYRRKLQLPDGGHAALVRPMLNMTHQDAKTFLSFLDAEGRQDSSNDDWERFARNRIRHRIIPELEKINPEAVTALARFTETMQQHADFLASMAEEALETVESAEPSIYQRDAITQLHPALASAILNGLYADASPPESQLSDAHMQKMLEIAKTPGRGSYHLPGGVSFEAEGPSIRFRSSQETGQNFFPYSMPFHERILEIPGVISLGDDHRMFALEEPVPDQFPTDQPEDAWLSPEILRGGRLVVRRRRTGDRFQPLGMIEDVSLRRFMTNSKVPIAWRDRIPIVVSQESGKLVWVAGMRSAEWAKVLPRHSRCVHLSIRKRDDADSTPL